MTSEDRDRQTGDRHGEGSVLNNLGLALREVGRLEEAITAHQDASAIFRETGDRNRGEMAVNNLKLVQGAKAEADHEK